MKKNCFVVLLTVFVLSLNVFTAGQSSGKKLKHLPAPKSAQSLVSGLNNSSPSSNIIANLKKFIRKVGLNPAQTKLYSSPKMYSPTSISSGTMQKLSAPQPVNKTGIKKIILDNKFGTPRLIDVNRVSINKRNVVLSKSSSTAQAMDFLQSHKDVLKISDPQNEFSLKSVITDKLGMTHVRYEQTYKGLKVWGKEIYIHFDKLGNIIILNGRYAPTPLSVQDTTGKINSASAVTDAVNDFKKHILYKGFPKQLDKIFNYYGPEAQKIIWYDKQEQPHLAWYIEIRSGLSQDWYYFVDAENGNILNSYNNVCYDGSSTASGVDLNGVTRTFGTYQIGSNYYMMDASMPMFNAVQSQMPNNPVGAIVDLDLHDQDLSSNSTIYYVTSSNNQWNDPSSVSALYNAETTYNFYQNVFNRNSIDNNGMAIYSVLHVNSNGQPMDNAFWSGKVMCYGDGNTLFKPLAGGLDVAAHEMTHGVDQYTANLQYQDQSGALNESMSDVFASLVDSSNWTIGENVIKDYTTFPSGALRDLSNPHNGGVAGDLCWQPAVMSEYVNTTQDNGGVHVNSGIPNHAFYYVAASIGRKKAGEIWYRALTLYLTHTAQFLDARIATENAATDLFGASSAEVASVKTAWDNVQVYESTPPPPPPTSQVIGQNWILAVNTDPADTNSIYMAKTVIQTNADFSALSQTPVLTKPAVTDTSGLILFVDQNNDLRALYANPQNPQETILDTSGDWWSVAIGPGLNSFALTSKFIDTTIYYFDLTNNTNQAFKIRTPSYDAANTNTALFADALSFDPTGQNLIFDSYNQIINSLGDTLSYWNISLLNVKTGNISNVFPPLANGISVGNPSFSKTSPYRFTFDYWDVSTNKYYVMAADFNTGKSAVVAGPNSAAGYPSYSGDDKMIVFHSVDTTQSVSHNVIEQMPLESDLITGTGSAQPYLTDATFPVWFVIGSRVTDVQDKNIVTPQTISLGQNYPNPFNPATRIVYKLNKEEKVTLKIFNVLGEEITTLVNKVESAGNYDVTFNASNLPSGIYLYRMQAGSFIQTKKMILLK